MSSCGRVEVGCDVERVTVRGQEMAVERHGDGADNVVLLHGFQNDHRAWGPLVASPEHIEGAARSMRDLARIQELPRLAIPSDVPFQETADQFASDPVRFVDTLS